MENRDSKSPKTTVTGSYGYGWQQMWKYFLHFFLVFILLTLLSAPASFLQDYESFGSPGMIMLQLFATAYFFLVVPVFDFGADLIYLRGIRNENIDLGEIFIGFKNNYLNIILANLLLFAIIGIGLVFLIIPGIILACRLSFVTFLVMDKGMDPVGAVEKSWTMTRGHGWKVFGLYLLAIPIFIAGILFFVVGVLFAMIWIHAALTALYYAVDMKDQEKLAEEDQLIEIEE
jgi:uncharacterized membrane protein